MGDLSSMFRRAIAQIALPVSGTSPGIFSNSSKTDTKAWMSLNGISFGGFKTVLTKYLINKRLCSSRPCVNLGGEGFGFIGLRVQVRSLCYEARGGGTWAFWVSG